MSVSTSAPFKSDVREDCAVGMGGAGYFWLGMTVGPKIKLGQHTARGTRREEVFLRVPPGSPWTITVHFSLLTDGLVGFAHLSWV